MAKMNWDTPWKEVLSRFVRYVLALLLPEAHDDIDWTRDPEDMETEMRKLFPDSETGERRVDKLYKFWLKGDRGEFAILHMDVQNQVEDIFTHRMHEYSNVLEVHLNEDVDALAILGDDNPDWYPSAYRRSHWRTRKDYHFAVVKLLHWKGSEDQLESSENPFAVFVLAHLITLRTTLDDPDRLVWKLRLAQNYLERKMLEVDRTDWLRLLEWILPLTDADHKVYCARLIQMMKGDTVPFVSFLEERENMAVATAVDAALKNQELAIRRENTTELLKTRFPEEAKALMPRVAALEDAALLKRLFETALTGPFTDVAKLLA